MRPSRIVLLLWSALIAVLLIVELAEITHIFKLPIGTAIADPVALVFALIFTTILALVGAIFIGIYISNRMLRPSGFTPFEEEMLRMRKELQELQQSVEQVRQAVAPGAKEAASPASGGGGPVKVPVLDNGGQWTHREWRVLRDLGAETGSSPTRRRSPAGRRRRIVLSGGALSLEEREAPLGRDRRVDRQCDGAGPRHLRGPSVLGRHFGGTVARAGSPEFGAVDLTVDRPDHLLFAELPTHLKRLGEPQRPGRDRAAGLVGPGPLRGVPDRGDVAPRPTDLGRTVPPRGRAHGRRTRALPPLPRGLPPLAPRDNSDRFPLGRTGPPWRGCEKAQGSGAGPARPGEGARRDGRPPPAPAHRRLPDRPVRPASGAGPRGGAGGARRCRTSRSALPPRRPARSGVRRAPQLRPRAVLAGRSSRTSSPGGVVSYAPLARTRPGSGGRGPTVGRPVPRPARLHRLGPQRVPFLRQPSDPLVHRPLGPASRGVPDREDRRTSRTVSSRTRRTTGTTVPISRTASRARSSRSAGREPEQRSGVCCRCAKDDRHLLGTLSDGTASPNPSEEFPVRAELNVRCTGGAECAPRRPAAARPGPPG